MHEIQFLGKKEEIGKIYVWGEDLEKARLCLEKHECHILKINECSILNWLLKAYIKEPEKRFRKCWIKD